MKKKYSYVGIAFIILLFGIYAIPKIVNRFEDSDLMKFGKVPDFEFINQEGETITNANYKDKVYVVEFFFSTCPSICPIMNQKMLVLQNSFFGNPEFGIASISITPEIDTPAILKEYAKNNGITHKNWHLLTGKPEEVVYDLSTKGFKLYVGKGEEEHGGFEHSGLFALVDKDGYIRSRKDELGNPLMYYSALGDKDFPDQMKELKEDIKLLLNE
ncbi:SCO family protein [Polaribacter dokdonensis]|jgi:protein SCO1|uniref:Protein SCO1/2 n=1 Tax=Polaribacter dokdonensis DSW-5 TaxID=1300348 RepID=A0A0M9CHF6_9FLAO|nr:SCO family protein [Polaribacter dokdonensis]KOY52025.1 SCO2/SenC family protein [Polaribacter dokdonensis DSW-5]SED97486.1 protein SCO1/2 [Polaribacter dokdonensis DSW-5]